MTAAADTLNKDQPARSLDIGLSSLTPAGVLLIFAILLCYGGFVVEFAGRLLKTDHYQFAPVYVAAVVCLFSSRLSICSPAPKRRLRWQPLTVGLSLTVLLPALFFRSPLLGTISLLLLIDGLIPAYRMSRKALRLLWVLIPLPLGYDRSIVIELQRLSSRLAAAVLDFWRVPHSMSGNVLELPGQRLLVEEACSGLGSIYLLLAVSLLVAVTTHMRFFRAFPLGISSVIWAIVGNVLRIVIIAVAHTKYQTDLSNGWSHEALGITTMLLSVAGIALTAMLLNQLISPVSNVFDSDSKVSRFLTPEILWNVCTTNDFGFRRPLSQPGLHIKSRPKVLVIIFLCLMSSAAVYWSKVDLKRWLLPTTESMSSSSSVSGRASIRFENYSPAAVYPDADIAELPLPAQPKSFGVRQWEIWSAERSVKLTLTVHVVDSPPLLKPAVGDGWTVLSMNRFPVFRPAVEDAIGVGILGRDLEYAMFAFCCFRSNGEAVEAPNNRTLTGQTSGTSSMLPPGSASESTMYSLSLFTSTASRPTDFDLKQTADNFRSVFEDLLRQWKAQPPKLTKPEVKP